MPGGGTSKSTTTENRTSDPWAPAIPGLTSLVNRASELSNAGVGSTVYSGDRTAGLGADTKTGLNLMREGARAGAPTAAAGNGFVGGLLSDGGTTAGTRAATAGLKGVDTDVDTAGVAGATAGLSGPGNVASRTGNALAGGAYATDTAPIAGLARSMAGGSTQTERSLQDVADGKYLGGANPYLDDVIGRSANEAASSVGQRFAASGRYGSGRFAGATADAVAGIGTKLRYDDYNAERERQAQAATAIDAAGNARAGLAGNLLSTVAGVNQGNASVAATGAGLAQGALRDRLSGETALAGIEGDNASRALGQANALLSSAQSDRAAGLAGIASMPTVQAALEQPGRTIASLGGVYDAARQTEMDSNRAVYEEERDAPWRSLGLASSIINPIAGLGGTSQGTAVTTQPKPSFLQQALGFALAGANVASKFYGAP